MDIEESNEILPYDVLFPRFAVLGKGYPFALEKKYERILRKIDFAWETKDIDEVISELIIDRRGGRQGFPTDVLNDIVRIKAFRRSEHIILEKIKQNAISQLQKRGLALYEYDFLRALNSGDQKLLDHFLNAGFSFRHIRDKDGSTPLLIALKKGYTVCAHMLLNAGDYPNAQDNLGLTPLLISCGSPTRGFRAIASLLISRGAHIDVRDALNNTPLLLAMSGGNLDIAIILIKAGADKTVSNSDGDCVLSLLDSYPDKTSPDYLALCALLKN